MRPAVFLDRDGTINVDRGHVWRPEELQLIPGADDAILRLNRAGALVIVVTNQSGVARGLLGEDDVERFHRCLAGQLAEVGARIDAFYYCPYHPTARRHPYRRRSSLRKPDVGMFELATEDFNIDVARSWVVGDKLDDMRFAKQAGLRGILVRTGGGERALSEHDAEPFFLVADSIVDAVARILDERALGG